MWLCGFLQNFHIQGFYLFRDFFIMKGTPPQVYQVLFKPRLLNASPELNNFLKKNLIHEERFVKTVSNILF